MNRILTAALLGVVYECQGDLFTGLKKCGYITLIGTFVLDS